RPASTASRIASMFEPRPEIRMPIVLIAHIIADSVRTVKIRVIHVIRGVHSPAHMLISRTARAALLSAVCLAAAHAAPPAAPDERPADPRPLAPIPPATSPGALKPPPAGALSDRVVT